jgi:hypothetical protein
MPVSGIFSGGAGFTNLGLSKRGAGSERPHDTGFSPPAIDQVETPIKQTTASPGIATPSAKEVSIDSITAIPDDLAELLKAAISSPRR